MFSDADSSEKTCAPLAAAKKKIKHVTMKCGWICLDCRRVEFKQHDLKLHLCSNGATVHKKVLCAGYMCQNCPAISDDIGAFLREECPCSFDEAAGPAGPASAARPAGGSPASSESRGLTIRHSPGRIGGTYLEIPCSPPPAAATPAPEPRPDPMPEPRKSDKQTWKDDSSSLRKNAAPTEPSAKTEHCELERDAVPVRPRPKPSCHPTMKAKIASAKLHKDAGHNPKAEVVLAVRQAEYQLQKLLVLKALEEERTVLEGLLLKKAQAESSLSAGG